MVDTKFLTNDSKQNPVQSNPVIPIPQKHYVLKTTFTGFIITVK